MRNMRKSFAIVAELAKRYQIDSNGFWDFIKDHYQITSRKQLTEEQWQVIANRLDAAKRSRKVRDGLTAKIRDFRELSIAEINGATVRAESMSESEFAEFQQEEAFKRRVDEVLDVEILEALEVLKRAARNPGERSR